MHAAFFSTIAWLVRDPGLHAAGPCPRMLSCLMLTFGAQGRRLCKSRGLCRGSDHPWHGKANAACASVGVGLGKAATFVCAGPQGHRLLGQGTGWAEAHLDVRRSISPGSATTTKCMCARRSRKILPSFFAMDSSSLGACSLRCKHGNRQYALPCLSLEQAACSATAVKQHRPTCR